MIRALAKYLRHVHVHVDATYVSYTKYYIRILLSVFIKVLRDFFSLKIVMNHALLMLKAEIRTIENYMYLFYSLSLSKIDCFENRLFYFSNVFYFAL